MRERIGIAAICLFAAIVFGLALYTGRELLLLAGVAVAAIGFQILRRPILGLYLALMLVPLEAVGRIVPTNSYMTWAKAVLIVTFIGLSQRLLLENSRLKLPPAGLSLYFVLLLGLIASAVWSSFGTPVWGVVAFVGQATVVVIAANVLTTPRQFENALVAILLGSSFVTVVGVLDVVMKRSVLGTMVSQIYASTQEGVFRVTATFYDPNVLGRYLAFAIVITICAFRLPRLRRFAPLLAVLLFAQGFVLLNTFSRGAFLSLMVVLGLLLLWDREVGRKLTVAATVSALLGGVYLLSGGFGDILLRRLTGGGSTLAVDTSRIMIYQLGLKAFWQSPIVGFGQDNVPKAIGQFYPFALSPHNLYLEVLLAVGAVGFAAFAWFIIASIRLGLKTRSTPISIYGRPALFALIVVLLSGVTLHGFKSQELWASLSLLAALPNLSASGDGAS